MDIAQFLESLKSSGFAGWIRESLYAFPLIESFHVIGLTMVFGTIVIVDLRLLGLASVRRPFRQVASEVVKWTWLAFALTVTTGALMFITNATVYYRNPQFRFKMATLVLAGINMMVFELTTGRRAPRWDKDGAVPAAGRFAAVLSLALWISVIFLGRWVGFTAKSEAPAELEINIEDFLR